MKHLAIVAATQYGQTAKIAEFIRARSVAAGYKVEVLVITGRDDFVAFNPEPFDTVIVGCPVYAGSFNRALVEWAKFHADVLRFKHCGFFMVSMNRADARPEAKVADRELIASFLDQTGLKPTVVRSFAGAVNYTKYGLIMRWIMKSIVRRAGGPTDTHRDHELTDWDAVTAFTDAILTEGKSLSGNLLATS